MFTKEDGSFTFNHKEPLVFIYEPGANYGCMDMILNGEEVPSNIADELCDVFEGGVLGFDQLELVLRYLVGDKVEFESEEDSYDCECCGGQVDTVLYIKHTDFPDKSFVIQNSTHFGPEWLPNAEDVAEFIITGHMSKSDAF